MGKRKKTVLEVQIAEYHRFRGKELELGQLRQVREHRLDQGLKAACVKDRVLERPVL